MSTPPRFALRCFAPAPAALAISGTVQRRGEQLHLHYRIDDPTGRVRLPATAAPPRRRDELWTTTCLELFLAEPDAAPYWEVNLSPSGDWNVYRLTAYRQGLAPEPAITALPFTIERHAHGLELQLRLDLSALVPAGRPLDLAITAVLEEQGGEISYWALAHPGPEADFHRRDGFVLRV